MVLCFTGGGGGGSESSVPPWIRVCLAPSHEDYAFVCICSIYLSVYQSVCLSKSLHVFACPSVCVSLSLSICGVVLADHMDHTSLMPSISSLLLGLLTN